MWASLESLLEIETQRFPFQQLWKKAVFLKQSPDKVCKIWETLPVRPASLLLMPSAFYKYVLPIINHFGKLIACQLKLPHLRWKAQGKPVPNETVFYHPGLKKKMLTILKYTKLYTAQWVIESKCIYLMKANFLLLLLVCPKLQPVTVVDNQPS